MPAFVTRLFLYQFGNVPPLCGFYVFIVFRRLHHVCDFILPSNFWQAFFAPQEHPKIARSFNCGSTPPKNQAPPGRQTKSLRKILPPLRGLRIFTASNPQLKLRAILIRRPATKPVSLSLFIHPQLRKCQFYWILAVATARKPVASSRKAVAGRKQGVAGRRTGVATCRKAVASGKMGVATGRKGVASRRKPVAA